MRSNLVFGALAHTSNRYHLCRLVSKGTRRMHKPRFRLQDTTNDVLLCLAQPNLMRETPVAEEPASFETRRAA
jgi:hypothetical protein